MDNNWDDIWERRRDPHPCIKIYLKLVGLLACVWLIYLSWRYSVSDPVINIRCHLIRLKEDICYGIDRPGTLDVFSLCLHLVLYVIAPLFSIIAQTHHLLIWIFPSVWEHLPKRQFCHWHRGCYFPLYHALFIAATAAFTNMQAVSVYNPVDRRYEQNNISAYVISSLEALWTLMLLLQFPIYTKMTLCDEELLTYRLNNRFQQQEN